MKNNDRRCFLKTSALTTAASFTAPAFLRGQDLNSRIRIAVVGMGGRANAHARSLIELEQEGKANIEFAGICDCDRSKLDAASRAWKEKAGHAITTYDDMRRVLDDDAIDAVTFATPNHWHSLGVIWACQAGKDSYVEKPGSHNISEGRKMVQAARQYDRIVQHGTQCRSSENIIEGIRKLHEGIIGDVYFARGIAYKIRGDLGKHAPRPVPNGLDWDAWCGPAKLAEYSNFQHRRWHWLWNFGNGEIGNQGVHQMDILRWGLKLDSHPSSVSSVGTNYMQQKVHNSSAETPGLLSTTMKWPNGQLIEFEVRDWYTNAEAGFRDKYPFVQKDFPVGAIFLGSEGTMIIPDYSSYYTFLGQDRKEGPSASVPGSPISDTPHFRNWIHALHSRNHGELSAEIEEGHKSSALCHLANIAYRVDRTVQFDNPTETFHNDDDANALLARPPRSPYVVPEQV
ncbi:Gfo/Idh/MocA family protein [Novipirellula artificiosorum]|uniref:Putative oxidoreductase YcjS n=1 Tax=Novipirellula artificiosorum TaxID=2528016 RepID=A0A5C6D4M3_9BACT|nr:Gfo/Idh/MocA family oxidoreductase [Novipirellula artificiosorum]TWU31770.1 putative oxidoreductase YcjS [Novipirellula artificiosorum]